MRILITGGAGFIGTHIAEKLLDRGDEVVIYDNLSKGRRENVDQHATFIEGDLKDAKLLEKGLEGVEAVIHMASLIEVSESVQNPVLFADNNIVGAVSLLETMKNAGVKKIIFSSSACVYGEPEKLPITEDFPLKSANPYGASKIAVESFCETYHNLYGFDTIILRYFNPYGPGEMHQPETHAIPNLVKSAINKQQFTLYWKGEQVRDFIYVGDLATAHLAVLSTKGYQIYNIGTEKGVKVIDVLNKLSDILGYNVEYKDMGERKGDVMANYASYNKLNQDTGWEPKVSLEEGLRKTVKYFSKVKSKK